MVLVAAPGGGHARRLTELAPLMREAGELIAITGLDSKNWLGEMRWLEVQASLSKSLAAEKLLTTLHTVLEGGDSDPQRAKPTV